MAPSQDETFRYALAALQAGKANDAERLFKELLSADPKHIAGLNLLGILLTKLGRLEEAETYLRRALKENATSDVTFYNYGIVLKALKRPIDALERFSQALAINAKVAETWNNRGTVFNDLKHYSEAVDDFDNAISINPKYAEAYYNKGKSLAQLRMYDQSLRAFDAALALRPDFAEACSGRGYVFRELKRYDDAFAAYNKALTLKPDLAEAWGGRGNIFSEIKRYDDGFAAYDKALTLKPDLAEAWLGRGNIFSKLKRYDDACAAYDKALTLKPDLAEAWLGRGNIFSQLKRYDDVFAAYDKALTLKPDLAEAWLGRGNIFSELKRYDDAFAAYDKASMLNPDLAEAWLGRGNIFSELKRYDDALAACDKALTLKPDLAEAWLGRGNIFSKLTRYDDAFAAYDTALSLKPDLKFAEGARLHAKLMMCDWINLNAEVSHLLSAIRFDPLACEPFALLSIPSSSEDQLKCANWYAADRSSFPKLWCGETYSHERIRVAYLSATFHEHAIPYLIAGLFEQHDRSRFEITAISFGPDQQSDMRRRLKLSFEYFVDARLQTDQEIAELIRSREIDVAVDLMGFTEGARTNVFGRRPAPVQVNYLGYPGTMGADCIDYVLADRMVIPETHCGFYTEKVVWLPDCYQVNDVQRAISEATPKRSECSLPENAFVFCCFNNTYKITPDVFDVWMKLLGAVEDGILWLIETNPTATQNLRSEAKARGISPERLIFAPKIPHAGHLSRHRHADLFLDTLPYNAHTTASDSLWAGVPIVTRLGETFAGRVAASLLKAVGLPELITASLEDYEALALKLAREPSFLTAIKAKLARNRDTYPLFDTARFARHIEAAYTTMWERQQKGATPQSFAVDPIN